jgi:hypothetical protein
LITWHLIRELLGTNGLKEGATGVVGAVITVRTKPWGRKARPITNFTSTTLGKEEMVVCL